MTEPDLLITGERVALGPLRRDLAETYSRWVDQPDVRFGVEYLAIATPESGEAWVEESNRAAAGRSVSFTICDVSDRAPVGLFDISYLQAAGRSAARSASAATRGSAARRRG